ncbi:flavin-binding monooxygenase-like-domain-containing protein [Biscogniauxia marginata]|nr:flavin-binding monooxygenase-like-domain-containing protein [Biscogniauxia marginata]
MDKINIVVVGLEEGFNAVAFERRDKVGGLWSQSSDPTFTSALDETICNISKFVLDSPPFFASSDVAKYFDAYASHFELHRHVRFGTTVKKVTRNSSDNGWDVYITNSGGDSIMLFDKVVFGTGNQNIQMCPPIPSRDKFKGTVIHSQAYRSPEIFKDKKVLVVGLGNTACDVSLGLRKHTSKLYQANRRRRMIVSRYQDDGIPIDTQIPWPTLRLKYLIDHKLPWLINPIVDKFMVNKMISDAARSEPAESGLSRSKRLKRAEHRVREDWRLVPCSSLAHVHPAVQEDFMSALARGEIIPVQGVMPEIEMDGACGFPLKSAAEVYESNREVRTAGQEPHVPRLFQMIFPPRWASSVAFLSWVAPLETTWCVSELASMAVAQIWAAEAAKSVELSQLQRPANYRSPALLPSLDEMNAQVDAYHTWWRGEWEKEHSIRPGYVRAYSFYRFLHDAAGTGLYDNLDHIFTSRGWGLRWRDHELWTWLAKGPMNSLSWSLFETNPMDIAGCGRKI